jgi:hypothetical protein
MRSAASKGAFWPNLDHAAWRPHLGSFSAWRRECATRRLLFDISLRSRCTTMLADLDPDAARAGSIGAVDPLRNDARGAEPACMGEQPAQPVSARVASVVRWVPPSLYLRAVGLRPSFRALSIGWKALAHDANLFCRDAYWWRPRPERRSPSLGKGRRLADPRVTSVEIVDNQRTPATVRSRSSPVSASVPPPQAPCDYENDSGDNCN